MTHELAIEVADLQKSYRDVHVLTGIDLQVPRGSVYALLGPNGAGKTTTVHILATLLQPDGGRARVAGYDVVGDRRRVRRSISLTGQDTSVDDLQTGAENLWMMGRLAGLSRRETRRRAHALLERFDLADAGGRRVATYSGGMRRRLDLAASLLHRPTVIFLDEPTTGLDVTARLAIWREVRDLARSGVTVLLTTQYLEEADQLADRIAVIDHGIAVAEGTPAELKRQVMSQRLDLEVTDLAFDRILGQLGDRVMHADRASGTLGVGTDGSATGVRGLLDEVDPRQDAVTRFTVHTATLDDVFLSLTTRPAAPAESERENAGV